MIQHLVGPLTCPVCGVTTPEAVAEISVPPLVEAPLALHVGDALAPLVVPSYAPEFVHLRRAADPDRATAIVPWECETCGVERWALASFGGGGAAPILAGFEPVPVSPESLGRADWIHGAILARWIRDTEDHGRWPTPGALLDPGLLGRIAARIAAGSS